MLREMRAKALRFHFKIASIGEGQTDGDAQDGAEISPQQCEQVLPFLTDRSAYPEFYTNLRIEVAFREVQNAKKGKVFTAKSINDGGVRIIKALRVIEIAKENFFYKPLPQISAEEIRQERKKIEELIDIFSGPQKREGANRIMQGERPSTKRISFW
jgi:hypothetical protein